MGENNIKGDEKSGKGRCRLTCCLYLILVVRFVCDIDTARHAQTFATSVAVQLQRSVHVFLAVIRWKVDQQFVGGQVAPSVEHLVTGQ